MTQRLLMLTLVLFSRPFYAHASGQGMADSLTQRMESAANSILQLVSNGGIIAMALAALIVAVVLVFLLIMIMKR